MDTTQKQPPDGSDDQLTTESLPPLVAYHTEGEALEQAATQPGSLLEQYRHGRVEAETHRVSEEVTKEAQARLQSSAQSVPSKQGNGEVLPEAAGQEGTGPETMLGSSFTGEQTLPAPRYLRRLLVPLDGTPEAERPLPYASMLARLLHAHLVLGHITPTTDANKAAQALHIAGANRLSSQQEFEPEALPYLQDLRWRLSIPPDQVDAHHISAPSVVDGLLELVTIDDIGLVTVGLRSHTGADHFRLGKVVESLIRKSTTPVLLIPPDVAADSSLFTLRHILVPLDGSALAEEALAPLLGLLDQTQGSAGEPFAITLLRVAENQGKVPECRSYLEALRDVLLRMPVCSRAQVRAEIAIGAAPEALVGRIEYGTRDGDDAASCPAGPVDLLVMATHGRGGMQRLILGSVAEYVVPRVQIPVLVVHPAYLTM